MEKVKVEVKTEQNEVVVREGRASEIFEFRGRSFQAESHKAFCTLVKTKASVDNAVVAYNDSGLQCILDDTVRGHGFERVNYKYQYSLLAKEWLKILGQGATFEQKEMINFLKRQELGVIDEFDVLMYAVQNFRYALKIEGDFTREDDNNFTMMIKKGEMESMVKIPKFIYVNLELFEESDFMQRIEVEVEAVINQNEKPRFELSCPKFQRYEKAAKEDMLKHVKEDLKEYLVVAGVI